MHSSLQTIILCLSPTFVVRGNASNVLKSNFCKMLSHSSLWFTVHSWKETENRVIRQGVLCFCAWKCMWCFALKKHYFSGFTRYARDIIFCETTNCLPCIMYLFILLGQKHRLFLPTCISNLSPEFVEIRMFRNGKSFPRLNDVVPHMNNFFIPFAIFVCTMALFLLSLLNSNSNIWYNTKKIIEF